MTVLAVDCASSRLMELLRLRLRGRSAAWRTGEAVTGPARAAGDGLLLPLLPLLTARTAVLAGGRATPALTGLCDAGARAAAAGDVRAGAPPRAAAAPAAADRGARARTGAARVAALAECGRTAAGPTKPRAAGGSAGFTGLRCGAAATGDGFTAALGNATCTDAGRQGATGLAGCLAGVPASSRDGVANVGRVSTGCSEAGRT